MKLEINCSQDGKVVKSLLIVTDRDKTTVAVLELREYGLKEVWQPSYFKEFDKHEDARWMFLGILNGIAYEYANNS